MLPVFEIYCTCASIVDQQYLQDQLVLQILVPEERPDLNDNNSL